MSETVRLSNFASIANAVFNSVSANATAITAISVGGTAINSTSFAGTANNANNLGGSSLTTIQSQITGNAATAYANAVANAAALYQTTAGLSANVATLTANAAGFLGNSSGTLANIASWAVGNAATAYTNATTFAANASNITTGTLPDARLSSAVVNTSGNFTVAGNLNFTGSNNQFTNVNVTSAVNVGANVVANTTVIRVGNTGVHTSINSTAVNTGLITTSGNVAIGGALTVTGNLTVNGTYVTVSGNAVVYSDNMLFLNQGVIATITNVVGNGSVVVFTGNNNYQVGWDVLVSGVDPASYNGFYLNITAANSTSFSVANTNTSSYVSGGTARGQTEANPDLGIAAGYNDGTYRHAGFFRDASDGVWKVFDGYLPEPDTSVFIDTSNNSFNIASFQANVIYIGNTTVFGTANATNFTGTSNNATNFGGLSLATVQGQITGNAATAFTNATTFASNASNITTGTLPDARLSSAVVNTSGSFTLGGNFTYNANLTIAATGELIIANGAGIFANGTLGSAGQVLTSNGVGVYWATAAGGGVNTAAQFTWTNTHLFTANVTFQNFTDIKTYVEVESSPTISASTLTLDLSNSTIFDVSLNSNITTLSITNVPATAARAVNFVLVFTADGTARSIVWPASFRWPGNVAPTITSTNGRRDVFSFLSTDNGTSWNAFISGQNL